MTWFLEDKKIESIQDVPEGAIGFIYLITNPESEKYYIGKKSLYSTRKLPPLKGMKRKRTVTSESDWLKYMSSNRDVKKWIDVERYILEFAYTKKELTYLENKALYCLGVLEDEKSMNENISGKFFKDEFIKK
jgi:hypothetical protein